MAPTPRKQRGANAAVPAGATAEFGYSTNWNFGRLGDFIKPLTGLHGLRELEKMVDRDETIGAMMFLINCALAQVKFQHAPMKDGVDAPDDSAAKNAAEFADTLLTDLEDTDWYEHLEEALTMVWAGFAPCEIVLRQRTRENGSKFNDSYYGVRSLFLRDQVSIGQWVYSADNQTLEGFIQVGGRKVIPIWKTCLYRTSSVLKRPTGKSLIANAYRVWRLKTKIQDAEAIGIEREMAGLPTFRCPSDLMQKAAETGSDNKPTGDALKAQAQIQGMVDAVRKMRFNENGGLVLPSDPWSLTGDTTSDKAQYDFSIVTSAGQRSIDARTAANDHDRAMARVLLMQFLQLGSRAGGSYGLSDDQSSIALQALLAFALKICRTFTRSVLPLVWTANGMDPRYMPELRPQALTKEDISKIGTYLAGLSRAMPMIEGDPDARVQALARAGIKADPAKQIGSLQPQSSQADLFNQDGSTPSSDNPAPSGQQEQK